MPVRVTSRLGVCRRATSCLIATLTVAVSVGAAEPVAGSKLDCGENALFVFLHLEGCTATLDHVASVLPSRHPDGYSMAELARAAKALGLRVEGVTFNRGDKALTRSAIAFFRDAKGGHFAVLRPVGITGTMVQVVDPPNMPWIADYDRLFSSGQWTGQVLVPTEPWIIRNTFALVIGAGGFILVGTGLAYGLKIIGRPSRRQAVSCAVSCD
jgi:Peptidase C39 family